MAFIAVPLSFSTDRAAEKNATAAPAAGRKSLEVLLCATI
jgi:hypothetical protein